MNEQLKEIMEIEAVQGIVYFSFEGGIIFQYHRKEAPQGLSSLNLASFAAVLNHLQEAEFFFENAILYIIKGRNGFLLAALSRSAPVALVRLNANILLSTLDKKASKPRGLARFLKRQPRKTAE